MIHEKEYQDDTAAYRDRGSGRVRPLAVVIYSDTVAKKDSPGSSGLFFCSKRKMCYHYQHEQ